MKILFHSQCTDGAGAALAAWLRLGDDGNEYIPVTYGEAPPDVAREEVYILDFSYPRDVLIEMAKTAKKITIIDHHESAVPIAAPFPLYSGLDKLCEIRVTLSMEHSGAVLAWRHFHPDAPLPVLFKLIEDRDLWRGKHPATNKVHAALLSRPDWRAWGQFIDPRKVHPQLVKEGAAIQRFMAVQVAVILEAKAGVLVSSGGHKVPCYNAPKFMTSDLLDVLLDKYPDAPFVSAFYAGPEHYVYSLRSRKGGVNVAKIAEAYGGGGHASAAGFQVEVTA